MGDGEGVKKERDGGENQAWDLSHSRQESMAAPQGHCFDTTAFSMGIDKFERLRNHLCLWFLYDFVRLCAVRDKYHTWYLDSRVSAFILTHPNSFDQLHRFHIMQYCCGYCKMKQL